MGELSDEQMVDAIRNRHRYANAVDTVTLLKNEGYIIFIFHGNVANFIIVINNEWKARRMCQQPTYLVYHLYRHSKDEGRMQTQV
jgi:hypothetical protein